MNVRRRTCHPSPPYRPASVARCPIATDNHQLVLGRGKVMVLRAGSIPCPHRHRRLDLGRAAANEAAKTPLRHRLRVDDPVLSRCDVGDLGRCRTRLRTGQTAYPTAPPTLVGLRTLHATEAISCPATATAVWRWP